MPRASAIARRAAGGLVTAAAARSTCLASAQRIPTRQYFRAHRSGAAVLGSGGLIESRMAKRGSVEVGAASTSGSMVEDVVDARVLLRKSSSDAEAAETERVAFAKSTPEVQIAATSITSALLGFSTLSDDLPALRLAILTYALWATGEWVVHKYFMHAKDGSFGDRVTHLNKLHVVHHLDTHKDMTMKEDFERDALYFHFQNSMVQIAFATSVLFGADVLLDLDIPGWWTPVAAVLGMGTHNIMWNTMHLDMHEVPGDYDDGMPCASYDREGLFRPYVQWVFDNHTTHHDVGGGWNYNIICPGPDFLLGTYKHRSKSVQLTRSADR